MTGPGLAVAVAMGSFAGAILVANNLRDVASDGRAGKRTLAVVLGVRRTQVVFGGLLALPFVACLSVAGGRGHRADRRGAGRRRGALWSALVGRCARRSFDSAVNERANTLRWPRGPRRYELAILAELRAFRPQAFVRPLAASPTPWSWLGPETTPGTTMTWVKVGTAAASPTPWSWLGPGTAARTLPGCGWGVRLGGAAGVRRRSWRPPCRQHPVVRAGMRICPDAELDDSLLDVTVVGPLSRTALLRLYPTVRSGAHVRHPAVTTRRAQAVTLAAAGVVGYADGERLGPLPLRNECRAGALRVLAPAGSHRT